jgi:HSP20 family protein
MNIVRRQGSNPTAAPVPAQSQWDPFRMMRDLVRWDPFRELGPMYTGETARSLVYAPDVDVKETANAYVFKADVPGIKEKDLEVSTTGNRLTLSGKREEERHEDTSTYHASERCWGSFSRSFTLPDGIDLDHASAELKEGVLTITVPKKPEVQPKKIPFGASTPDKIKS